MSRWPGSQTSGGGNPTEATLTLADNTTDDVTSTKHGFAPKSPADATKFLNGGATPGWTAPPPDLNPAPRPNANSLLGYSADPASCSTARTPAAAVIYLTKIMLPVTTTIANVLVSLSTAGTSYTNAQLGVYSSAGVLLGASAVQASAGTNGFGAAPPVIVSLPVTVIGGQSLTITGSPTAYVWTALHMGTNSATAAIFQGMGGGSVSVNAGLTASTARVASTNGHATNDLATIGSLTPSGFNITNSTACLFMGVS